MVRYLLVTWFMAMGCITTTSDVQAVSKAPATANFSMSNAVDASCMLGNPGPNPNIPGWILESLIDIAAAEWGTTYSKMYGYYLVEEMVITEFGCECTWNLDYLGTCISVDIGDIL